MIQQPWEILYFILKITAGQGGGQELLFFIVLDDCRTENVEKVQRVCWIF